MTLYCKNSIKKWKLLSSQDVVKRCFHTPMNAVMNMLFSFYYGSLVVVSGSAFLLLISGQHIPAELMIAMISIASVFVLQVQSELSSGVSFLSRSRMFFAKRKMKKMGFDPDMYPSDFEQLLQNNTFKEDVFLKCRSLTSVELKQLHENVLASEQHDIITVWKQWLRSSNPVRVEDQDMLNAVLNIEQSNTDHQHDIKTQLLQDMGDVMIDDVEDVNIEISLPQPVALQQKI